MRSLKLMEFRNTHLRQLVNNNVVLIIALLLVCLFSFPPAFAVAKEVQRLPHEPNNPKIMQVYFNTSDNREYIYNGQEWVPHDASVDTYELKHYKKAKDKKTTDSNGTSTSNSQGVSK
ncbi:hypothetical protein GMST_04940 [Geomonas silvestris]|uniref:Uncharacterized protein n=1 Tax=Geomonas silvestris TaxID=2740184 RepID=A0A6V8MES0_9BACT|nr:hypothetical protein [Geomonas silvestris]GFO58169.1 hypothetical protein GMST_04940 [Geomonas silvestris]